MSRATDRRRVDGRKGAHRSPPPVVLVALAALAGLLSGAGCRPDVDTERVGGHPRQVVEIDPDDLHPRVRDVHSRTEVALDALESARSAALELQEATDGQSAAPFREVIERIDTAGYLLVEQRPEIPNVDQFRASVDHRANVWQDAVNACSDSLIEIRHALDRAMSLRTPTPAALRGRLSELESLLRVAAEELEQALRAIGAPERITPA
jgi:hypothetical protein